MIVTTHWSWRQNSGNTTTARKLGSSQTARAWKTALLEEHYSYDMMLTQVIRYAIAERPGCDWSQYFSGLAHRGAR
jgi:hypothetical protein